MEVYTNEPHRYGKLILWPPIFQGTRQLDCSLRKFAKFWSKIYDLKGSTRNRHVKSTGRENEVLLDENLVQCESQNGWSRCHIISHSPGDKRAAAHLAPFYLREHSKRILRGALYNDSKFLSDINVMDYSLVVGVDSQKNELVVGIVGK
jgi:1-phosphatidylinositol-3-phosphate 5-kinase